MTGSRTHRHGASREDLFLPSFCGIRIVFAVVVLAELLAIVLVLAPTDQPGDRWVDLGLVSLFLQWVALCSAAVLCLARPALARLGDTAAAVVSHLLMLVVTGAISELTWQVSRLISDWSALVPGGHAGFLLRNLAISAVISALALRYFYMRHQWEQQVHAEARARVQALQARIRPHFLFNSLNTIAALTASRPAQAEEAVQDLADLFRATLQDGTETVSLADEVALARRYLHMESLRLGDRLRVEWDLDGVPLDASLPALVLQPLLENAIYHGIEPRAEGGTVAVRGRLEGATIRLAVSNPLPAAGGARHAGNRMALDNIRQRLALAFGAQAGIASTEVHDAYRVELHFPREVPA